MSTALLGTSAGVFVGVSVVLMGFAAFMTGQALANTWKPAWHAAAYCVLLGFVARFLIFALFDGTLLTLTGLVADIVVLALIGLASHRLALARKMVAQYPWLYQRAGPFGWRGRKGGPAPGGPVAPED